MAVTRDTLLNSMLDTKPSDRSLLQVTQSAKPSSDLTFNTTAGSGSFRLWSQMAEFGWMVGLPDIVIPTAPDVTLKRFALTDVGRAAMPGVF